MTSTNNSIGRAGFTSQYGLHSQERQQYTERALSIVGSKKIETIRLSFADQHGILRGKTIMADDFANAIENGCSITSTLLLKDTSHRTAFPIWAQEGAFGLKALIGGADFIMVPDPETFRILPWSPHTGWVLCDLYFTDGEPVPFSSRLVCRQALQTLATEGYEFHAGLEVEFHVLKMMDPCLHPTQAGHPPEPPRAELLARGYQYLTELRTDELEPVLDLLRRTALNLGLPVRSVEVEFGPSQVEFTFHPASGLTNADNMVMFRNAVKQVCRRNGYHATFMCRPALPNLFSSGWHLHQSLVDKKTGGNVFIPENHQDILSATGRHYAGGLLQHAAACCVFTTPTINGYKRYRPFSLAPDRIAWGYDNRGAMLRAIGGNNNPATRIENRIGEPAANPYLYFASQIYAGLDGIKTQADPGPPCNTPYSIEAPVLPRNLHEAVRALLANTTIKEAMGQTFVEYIAAIKDAETARFMSEVTDWEQKEYFEIF
ncbi:MAG: glutamine synthetase family protein [Pseudomonadota bacterium]